MPTVLSFAPLPSHSRERERKIARGAVAIQVRYLDMMLDDALNFT